MMTEKARELGMHETYYHNASGLPDPLQITTASDLAMLARHLAYDFPQYFPYFALPGFTYKGTYYPTHDNLIGRYDGADGIKTGYTGASGFNLVSSVVRDGVHLIGVVMGGRTAVRRDLEMVHLLDTAFAQIDANPTLVARGPVPWTTPSEVSPKVATAGFALASKDGSGKQYAALSALPPPIPANDDEDAAESVRAPDEISSASSTTPQASKPGPASNPVVAALTPAADPVPRPAPGAAARVAEPAQEGSAPAASEPKPVTVAALPKVRPAPETGSGEGDQDPPNPTTHNWTIQIGAYADRALARAQLDAYAQKSMDVLGQAARLIIPFQASDGHTMYRARFGLFAERQARAVCDRLTQRGQTCFAAVSSR